MLLAIYYSAYYGIITNPKHHLGFNLCCFILTMLRSKMQASTKDLVNLFNINSGVIGGKRVEFITSLNLCQSATIITANYNSLSTPLSL